MIEADIVLYRFNVKILEKHVELSRLESMTFGTKQNNSIQIPTQYGWEGVRDFHGVIFTDGYLLYARSDVASAIVVDNVWSWKKDAVLAVPVSNIGFGWEENHHHRYRFEIIQSAKYREAGHRHPR
ncbi:MAG: hypothetical protein HGA85_00655 [Nanoarchaeota archaeon]|nr:hypothetical protein [Nanoarchaeota archaeon]